MKVSVFGLGYVGVVSCACLARDGHAVVGVDTNADKVDLVASGRSPIVEPGVQELLAAGVLKGLITATSSARDAVAGSDVSLVSVGTPPSPEGRTDLSFVERVVEDLGHAVADKGKPHTVVMRSTVPPGTSVSCLERLRELVGGSEVHLAMNPEFLREGQAIQDYDQPPYTIIGTDDPDAEGVVRELYSGVDAPVLVVKPDVAEMVKYVANTWHATKVSFANEIGRLSKALGLDGREVMRIIVQDSKLNVSPVYMRPGFAYGGSCLPKDVASLLHIADELKVPLRLLPSLPAANALQADLAAAMVMETGARRVAVLGLAFKPGTDDLRESAAVVLVKRLLGEGLQVRIYDRDVREARLVGTNLAYIRENIPHFEALLGDSLDSVLSDAELVVVTYASSEFREALASAPQRPRKIIDLGGLFEAPPGDSDYIGIAW